MNENRKALVLRGNNQWITTSFHFLKKGDFFRLFEPSGEPVTYNGKLIMKALSDPYIGKEGVWTIKAE